MSNRHGLDTDYIGKNLEYLIAEIDNYTPEEMELALMRISGTCVVVVNECGEPFSMPSRIISG